MSLPLVYIDKNINARAFHVRQDQVAKTPYGRRPCDQRQTEQGEEGSWSCVHGWSRLLIDIGITLVPSNLGGCFNQGRGARVHTNIGQPVGGTIRFSSWLLLNITRVWYFIIIDIWYSCRPQWHRHATELVSHATRLDFRYYFDIIDKPYPVYNSTHGSSLARNDKCYWSAVSIDIDIWISILYRFCLPISGWYYE